MKVALFGATGFVGWAVLHEALEATEVSEVLAISRKPLGVQHAKLRELIVQDVGVLETIAHELSGIDACFWCLGTSSRGLDEETYTKITFTYAVNAAKLLGGANPGLRFVFISGEGADGKAMWARVKKRTEDALLAARELRTVILRPAFIKSSHGAKLRGWLYRLGYGTMLAAYPIFRALGWASSGAEIGRTMIVTSRREPEDRILRSRDINRLASATPRKH